MVNNQVYENALKDHDNMMIMHSAGSKFIHVLDEDEIYRCKLIALWGALRAWKPDGGSKFTAFLYQRVRWECLKSLQNKREMSSIQLNDVDREVLTDTPIFEILEIFSDDIQDMIEKRYIHGMTLREIGEQHGYSYEAIRKKLQKASKNLEKAYS